ncbi:hypothetical protein [Plantibacter sp. LMC-P-059a]|uniref:hypothetical protein n=1 Tax=Plantibacter sp. LMC-P-059a TaxID=3040297 RepID=UPI002551B6F1|nr:hypothetical protein [Plantibacter sp. LMC-P-059a]
MTGEHARAGTGVRSNRSIGRVAILLTGFLLAGLWTTTVAAPAWATPEPLPAPSPSDSSAAPTPTPPPLDGPTITSPATGSFIGSGSVTVTGTKDTGTGIQLQLGDGVEPACILPQDDGTDWSCSVVLPDGGGIPITAVEVGAPETLSAQVSVSALAPPTITAGTPSNGGVRGTAYPGATVTVRADSGASCSFAADSSGSWFCVLGEPLPAGDLSITATQQASFTGGRRSDASAPVVLSIDRDAPAPPVMTSPVAGQAMPLAASTYAGTGEAGATVTVFADSTSVCTAVVVDGSWTCSGAGVPAGAHVVLAIQQDAAGNTSGASTPATLTFGDAAGAPATPAPSSPSPLPTDGASPSPAPGSQAPGTQQPTPSPNGEPTPGAAPPVGGGGGLWSGSTPFSQTLSSTIDGRGQPVWWLAALLALAALALVAVPARLLATSTAGWLSLVGEHGRAPVTGRNRPRSEFERPPSVPLPNRSILAVVTTVLAAGILMFAHPVVGQPAYLRLWFASVLAVVAINAAGLLAQLVVARRSALGPMRVSIRSGGLVTVGVVTALSRLLALQPALLFALLVDLRPVPTSESSDQDADAAPGAVAPARAVGVSTQTAGHLALARIAAAAVVGALAWLVSALAGEPSGAVGAMLVEAVNLTAIAGIGSASIALLPLGPLGGRAVLDWSKPVWLGSAFLSFTLLFGLLGPTATMPGATDTLVGILLGALVFATIGAGAWAWRRHIRPLLDTH